MKKIVSLTLSLVLSGLLLADCSDNSEPFEEKSYTPDAQVEEINLDVRDREIEVSLSQDEQVHIQYYENSKEYYDISVSDENVLTMKNVSDKEWTDYIGGKPSGKVGKITLQIPDALLDTAVKNGDVSGTVVGSYDDFAIQTEIKKGESNLPDSKDGGEKTLKVSANNGDNNIEFVNQ